MATDMRIDASKANTATIIFALQEYAKCRRNEASGRSNAGPSYAQRRADLRERAKLAEDMAEQITTGYNVNGYAELP